MNEKIIWYIDEDQDELETFTNRLSRIFSKALKSKSELEVKGEQARSNIEDYYDILNDPRTVGIIIDQRLQDEGTADYTGIQLAEHLRSINIKLPIYILTQYADDEIFKGREWSVEYILAKQKLKDTQISVAQRVLRHINIYHDIVEGREKRFGELIRKSLSEELTEEEKRELKLIGAERTAGIAAAEIQELTVLENLVESLERANKKLQDDIDKLSDFDANEE